MTQVRPCLRCHLPLLPDLAILHDAQRAGITLDVLPLRCAHGHTERLPLGPPRRVRYVATCGYCGAPVFETKRNGKGPLENHRACLPRHRTGPPPKPHHIVAVDV